MSFHNTEFHESKRERKFYEGKKQKALTYIDHTIEDWLHGQVSSNKSRIKKLLSIKKLVNDI